MNIVNLVIATYFGLVTLICDAQPLPQPPTFADDQLALTCLITLNTGKAESAWIFQGLLYSTTPPKANIRTNAY